MERAKRTWQYLLAESVSWIFLAFFQPRRLQREFVPDGFLPQLRMMLRLIVPMFLIAFPLALVGRLIYLELGLIHDPDAATFLFTIAVAIGGGIAVGIAGGIAFGIAGGIAFGIAIGIAGGI